ncbi:formylglycine-generating enzyme family protein [Desulfococcus sp.]|uniref:formylglycine-generating enzyme family protein n=1 Tax=Desulfococcus sp. TaxID=2025834 RepID=UPI0035942DD9
MSPGTNSIPYYIINPADGTELVLIPGGWFRMGSEDDDPDAYDNREKPRHLHWVGPFYLGIACVTVAQFRLFAGQTGHEAGYGWRQDPDDHPVRYVSWHDAAAYCKWADLRLPTEAEWELAARGYGALKYPWGDDWEEGRRVCWDGRKGPKGNTAPVFDHPKGVGRFGCFQQSGNLWEWCADAGDRDAYKRYAQGDFRMPDQGDRRVLRGGSWYSMLRPSPSHFRGGDRYSNYDDPGLRVGYFGFRAAGTVTL